MGASLAGGGTLHPQQGSFSREMLVIAAVLPSDAPLGASGSVPR